jgi:TrmH family RNA methyltransferase
MVTKARLKVIKSLSRKKNRIDHKLFIVEGYKSIKELILAGMNVSEIYVAQHCHELDEYDSILITEKDMKMMSSLSTPPGYLAVFKIPEPMDLPKSGSVIALENLQDPGNLGTIIRLADWFNIKDIICSTQTVDVYNPKCIQSSMGSIARVRVHYTDLLDYLKETPLKVYPTTMIGTSMHEVEFQEHAVLLMGSESHGLSDELLALAPAISIPQNSENATTESLNVAMATALLLGEWKRPTGK